MVSVDIGGQTWRVSVRKRLPKKTVGLCDYATRTIYIKRGLNIYDTVGTAIHEAVHATMPRASEDAVANVERAAVAVVVAALSQHS